jgi:hypothetical protein
LHGRRHFRSNHAPDGFVDLIGARTTVPLSLKAGAQIPEKTGITSSAAHFIQAEISFFEAKRHASPILAKNVSVI